MQNQLLLLLLLLTCLLSSAIATDTNTELTPTYIVHVSPSKKPTTLTSHRHWHRQILRSVAGADTPLYSYTRAASGFSARLTEDQVAALRRLPSVLAVLRDQPRQPHTTRTPTFLRLSTTDGLWPLSGFASDAVVGVLDTGIYPSRPSFSDDGLGSPPAKWRGECVTANGFNVSAICNNKLIGAKFFYKGYEAAIGRSIDESVESKSPLDTEGHGTHTASTAAGAAVEDAGFFQYARGEARGMATKARIAAYKICWALGCFDSDILAAMDAAIDDGVDVISLSVGSSGHAPNFYQDSIAIGAFGAVRHGVVVSCSAGNSGPGPYTAVNIAPWILTVGASTIDREFPADVVLGDGSIYGGVSLYSGEPLDSSQIPLVYGGDCGSRLCISGNLDSAKVAGKIVLCDRGANARVAKGSAVKLAGGIGMILANTAESGEELIADSHLIAATTVGQIAGDKIRNYIKTDNSPTANINFRGTVIGASPSAPRVAAFSSRGPNFRAAEILKPDVIAPGVNILAGWTGESSPTDLDIDPRRVLFNIISGTSMSCPHVSGLAALLREAYPNWNPAAIKSALMTTAYNLDNAGETIKDLATNEASTPFVRGAGHVDPNRALNPGLVYDLKVDDYLAFLCSIGYSSDQIAVFTRDGSTVDCSDIALASPGDLNYPSLSVVFSGSNNVVTYNRVVRNVGSSGDAVYEAVINSPAGVNVTVNPSKLVFSTVDQSLSYSITFTSTKDATGSDAFGSISWNDGSHDVKSPIAVRWIQSLVSSI